MFRVILVFLLITCPLFVNAQEFDRKQDCLPFEDSDGNKICTEYDEVCRDNKGQFIKCSEGNVFKKVIRKCRNSETGRYIKCPPKEK